MLPARLHDTRQTTSGNLPGVVGVLWDAVGDGSRAVLTHGAVGASLVQMSTDLSYGMSEIHPSTSLHTTYLRCRGYIAPRQSNIWRPRDVAHPVSVPLERLLFDPCLSVVAKRPDFDKVVAAGAGKALKRRGRSWRSGLMRVDQRTGVGGGGPGDRIAPDGMAVKNIGNPLAVIWKRVQ